MYLFGHAAARLGSDRSIYSGDTNIGKIVLDMRTMQLGNYKYITIHTGTGYRYRCTGTGTCTMYYSSTGTGTGTACKKNMFFIALKNGFYCAKKKLYR